MDQHTSFALLTIPTLPRTLRPAVEELINQCLSPSEIAFEDPDFADPFMKWTRVPGGVSCKQILDGTESELKDLGRRLSQLADTHGFSYSMRPAKLVDLALAG
ncbi:MAG: hypothetical protein Q3962_07705 [Corynebacterium sp.]|nr:hypothetical protein [Corynebacterium sp.]